MPRQNRVTPWGEIISTAARGTLMGNRGGCLHDDAGQLGAARWRSRQWIACLLQFRGRTRTVMTPGRYTELFFLDEATALAAGHRPCAECRRQDFNAFRAAFLRGKPECGSAISAPELDRQLHAERVNRTGQKLTATAALDSLPDGVFVTLPEAPAAACLLWQGALYRWSPAGYEDPLPRPPHSSVVLLTPPSTAAAIAAGYTPAVHASVTVADKPVKQLSAER